MPASRDNRKSVRKRKLDKQNIAKDGTYFKHEISNEEAYDYLLIARQLCYPVSVQDAIMAAKSDLECERILHDAREKYW